MDAGFQPYSKAERLLNLLMALRSTRTGLDRDQIRAQVRGYRPDASPEAFERMFERDKDELRGLGIPIVTLTDASGVVTGYRIAREWNLPAIDLDPAELAVLSLSARVWQRADMAPAALNALRKVEAALGVEAALAGPAPVVGMTVDSPELLTLIEACTGRRPVGFRYRKAEDGSATRRSVHPWGVVWWRGHWYVVGWDLDRHDMRVFRVSRIDGGVRMQGPEGSFQVPEGFDARAAIGRFAPAGDVELLVALPPGEGAALRRAGRHLGQDGSDDVIALPVEDLASGVAQVLGSACEGVRVLQPPEAVAEAVRQLDAIIAGHEEPAARAGRVLPLAASPPEASAQFSRLLALVPWLAAHSGVSVAEAAAHFGVSQEQLLADLSSVITSGPDDWTLFDIQYWENGGVIEVIDALHLGRPLTLAPDEAFALLVALHALGALPGGGDRDVLERVTGKLRALLGERAPDPRAMAVRVDAPADVVGPIESALAQGRALELVYLGAVRDVVTTRLVDPIGMVVVDGYAYLRAHCRSAGDLRMFRLDRILGATVSHEPAHPVLGSGTPDVEPMAIVLAETGRRALIDLSPSGQHLRERHPVARAWALPDGWVRIELPVGDYAWARRLVLAERGSAVLREPEWLSKQVVQAARRVREAHLAHVGPYESLQ